MMMKKKCLKEQVAELEGNLAVLSERLQHEGQRIPNMTHPSIPIGSEDVASIRKEVTLSMSRIFNVSICSGRSGFYGLQERGCKSEVEAKGTGWQAMRVHISYEGPCGVGACS
jgi:seryl-tRNA synthetase